MVDPTFSGSLEDMLNVGLWRDMAKKEWPDGQMTWKKTKKHIYIYIYIEDIGSQLEAMNQHHIMLELPIVSQSGLKVLKKLWKTADMWTCSTLTFINHEHGVWMSGAFVWNDTVWLPPQISVGWKSNPIYPVFLAPRLLWFDMGQEWCKFDLEWALFKERLEVADKNMADSKLDAQVVP